MALSYNSASFMIISLLSIPFTLTSVKADLIDDVCSKTPKRDVCLSSLRANPRSKDANLEGLMMISTNLSQNNTQFVRNLVEKLFKQATDPKLKTRYALCWENYNDAIANLEKLPDLLKAKDYDGLNTHASTAQHNPSKCDDNFSGPPDEPPQLKDANDKLQGLIDIILAIIKLLKG